MMYLGAIPICLSQLASPLVTGEANFGGFGMIDVVGGKRVLERNEGRRKLMLCVRWGMRVKGEAIFVPEC